MVKLNLESHDTYKDSSILYLKQHLSRFFDDLSKISVEDLRPKVKVLNKYENMAHLKDLTQDHIILLDEDKIATKEAEELILNGEFFWEHAAAGEATRLGLGTKYILDLSELKEEDIIKLISNEAKEDAATKKELDEFMKSNRPEDIKKRMKGKPSNLLPLTLGRRHMLQMVYDVIKLAKKYKKDPKEILSKQKTLVILNEQTEKQILDEFVQFRFYGLKPENVFFMVQRPFPGISISKGKLKYDVESELRLHNHGNMVQQKLHKDIIFTVNKQGKKRYLSREEFKKILESQKIMLSYNIEDVKYLTDSIDLPGIALALQLKKKGYEMIMELVKQNPAKSQLGGAAFYDVKLDRVIMIESNQLQGIEPKDIKHLNRNFNYYLAPVKILETMEKEDLPLHFTVKESKGKAYIYLCTPQGDLNFLLKTAFVMRKNPEPIQNWKSAMTTPMTIAAMHEQDAQPGFKELADDIVLSR